MATLRYRLYKKGTFGYDILHLETNSAVVYRESGLSTVEESLAALESSVEAMGDVHDAANITKGILSIARGGTGTNKIDITPTAHSNNPITSDAVYTAITAINKKIETLQTDVHIKSATAPENTKVLWIEDIPDGVTKYYNGSEWVILPVGFTKD